MARMACGALLLAGGVAVASIFLGAVVLTLCAVHAGYDIHAGDSIEWEVHSGTDTTAGMPGTGALLRRAVWLAATLLPLVVLSPVAVLGASARRTVIYPLILRALSGGGPALQKWGQWSATRPDLFPQDLCDLLAKLHTKVPAHSWRHTRRVCEKALGQPLTEVFAKIGKSPVASGSIAQVHKAEMRSTGQEVAVKVRHPGVMEMLWTDVKLMRGLAWAVDTFVPALRFLQLPSSVAQFSHTIASQARLDHEANHLKEFRRNFASKAWRDIRIPQPIQATPEMLIQTFERGRPMGEARRTLSRQRALRVVERGQDVYLKMLMADGLMHADLHPGNMLFDTKGCDESDVNIVLIDFGMVANLTADEQVNFVGLFRSLGEGNGKNAAKFVLRFCPEGQQACVGACAKAFTADMVDFFRTDCRGFGTGTDFGTVLRGVLTLVRRHHVTISASYATLVVNSLCLDGLARELAPEYNLLDGCALLLRLSAVSSIPGGRKVMRRLYPAVSALGRLGRRFHRHDRLEESKELEL